MAEGLISVSQGFAFRDSPSLNPYPPAASFQNYLGVEHYRDQRYPANDGDPVECCKVQAKPVLLDILPPVLLNRCIGEKGEDSSDCVKYAKCYRSLCPGEWVSPMPHSSPTFVFLAS